MARTYALHDARIIFRNFAGAPDKFNRNGQIPNFSVIIPEEEVGYWKDDLQFNVKSRTNADGELYYYLKVKVGKYAAVYIKDEDGVMHQIPNDPESLAALDSMLFQTCDISIAPNDYDNGTIRGRSAYLSELFAQKGERSELYREWMQPDSTLDDD